MYAKIRISDLTKLNSVQNREILRLRRRKLHLTRSSMQSYQSFSNSLLATGNSNFQMIRLSCYKCFRSSNTNAFYLANKPNITSVFVFPSLQRLNQRLHRIKPLLSSILELFQKVKALDFNQLRRSKQGLQVQFPLKKN